MKVQVAFASGIGKNKINFVQIGRTIWPVTSIDVLAPLKFNSKPQRDRFGAKSFSMKKELLRGIEIMAGDIMITDHHGNQAVISYFDPESDHVSLQMSMGNMDEEMDMMGSMHPYIDFENEPILVYTEINEGENDSFVIPEPNVSFSDEGGVPVDSYEEYIKRFGDG